MSFLKLNKYKKTDYPEDLVIPKGDNEANIANYIKKHPKKNVNSNECACVIVRTKDNHFLFMQTVCLNDNQTVIKGSLEFPGGRIVYGEKKKVGACREFGEETGLTLNPDDLIEITNEVFNLFANAKSRKYNKHYYICEIPYTSKELTEKIKDRNNGIDADRGIPIFYVIHPEKLKVLENQFSSKRKDNYQIVLAINEGDIKYHQKKTSKDKIPLNGNYVEKHTKNKNELTVSYYGSLNEKFKKFLYNLYKRNKAIIPYKLYTRDETNLKRRGSAVDIDHNGLKPNHPLLNNSPSFFLKKAYNGKLRSNLIQVQVETLFHMINFYDDKRRFTRNTVIANTKLFYEKVGLNSSPSTSNKQWLSKSATNLKKLNTYTDQQINSQGMMSLSQFLSDVVGYSSNAKNKDMTQFVNIVANGYHGLPKCQSVAKLTRTQKIALAIHILVTGVTNENSLTDSEKICLLLLAKMIKISQAVTFEKNNCDPKESKKFRDEAKQMTQWIQALEKKKTLTNDSLEKRNKTIDKVIKNYLKIDDKTNHDGFRI